MSVSAITPHRPALNYWHSGMECCDPVWEAAYARFETPTEERQKFLRRFEQLGVVSWPREWQIVELFCGRGNGLAVLEQLGFENLRGVDLSPSLLEQYRGKAALHVGDCRDLLLTTESTDAAVVQGGLHHLPQVLDDLPRVLDEILRVLRPGGRVVIVEPWSTPFLQCVHFAARQRFLRRAWPRIDAFQVMTEREAETYFRWLSMPEEILAMVTARFEVERCHRRFGKLMFVGRKPG
jgi:SAM-dependent methyltransferase